MKKITFPNLKLPKFKFTKTVKAKISKLEKGAVAATDLSDINLRKFNGLTILSLLSYLNVLVLIPMIFARKSKFAQYHTRQGVALLFLWVLLFFSFYLPILPFVFAFMILVCLIIGIINVVTGHERRLPFVGRLVIN